MKRRAIRELSTVSNIQYEQKLIPSFVAKVKWKINLMKIKFNCVILKKSTWNQIGSVGFVPENSLKLFNVSTTLMKILVFKMSLGSTSPEPSPNGSAGG